MIADMDQMGVILKDLPVTNAQIRQWLDDRGIPVFIGVQTLFSEVRRVVCNNLEELFKRLDEGQ